jgi:hypothetical protein
MTLALVSAVSAPLYKGELIFPLESWHNHSSSVIQAKDGIIHITYSYFMPGGKVIKHVQLEEDWIKAKPWCSASEILSVMWHTLAALSKTP